MIVEFYQKSFFLLNTGLRPATLSKKRFWHRYFPVNFAKFLRTPFLQNTSYGDCLFCIYDNMTFFLLFNVKNLKCDSQSFDLCAKMQMGKKHCKSIQFNLKCCLSESPKLEQKGKFMLSDGCPPKDNEFSSRQKNFAYREAVAKMCSVKRVFLEFLKIHRKIPLPEFLFK